MLRKSALIVLGILLLLSGVVLYLVRDALVEELAESALSSSMGTRVDIDGLHINPWSLRTEFGRMQIADPEDPWRNRIELGQGRFDVNGLQLFAKRLIIDEMSIRDVALDTPRSESGALPVADPVATETPEESGGGLELDWERARAALPSINLSALTERLDIDGLVAQGELSAVQALEQAEAEGARKIDALQTRIEQQNFQARYRKLSADYRALKNLRVRTIDDFKRARGRAKALSADARKLRTDVSQALKQTRATWRELEAAFPDVAGLMRQDIAEIKKLANIGSLETGEVAEMLFGTAVMDTLQQSLRYLAIARTLAGAEEAPEPERRAGRWIRFPVTGEALPRLLIRHTALSGTSAGDDPWDYDIKAKHISSDQTVSGRPTTLVAELAHPKGEWSINGELDYRQAQAQNQFVIKGQRLRLDAISLQDEDMMLPVRFQPRRAEVNAEVRHSDGRLQAELDFVAPQVRFEFERESEARAKQPRLYRAVRELFEDMSGVTVHAKLVGVSGDLDMEAESNIDRLFSQRMKALFRQRVEEIESQIRAKVNAQVDGARASYERRISEKRQALARRVAQIERQVRAREREIEQRRRQIERQLQDKIDQEREALEQKAKDKLKDLLGR